MPKPSRFQNLENEKRAYLKKAFAKKKTQKIMQIQGFLDLKNKLENLTNSSNVEISEINLSESPLKNNQIPKNAIVLNNNKNINPDEQNFPEKILCIHFKETNKQVYATSHRLICETYDEQSIDAMVNTAKAMGWDKTYLIPTGQPGAIPKNLRDYACKAFEKVGITAIDPSLRQTDDFQLTAPTQHR